MDLRVDKAELKSANDSKREQIKDIEDKRQAQVDQERDYVRDIEVLAQEYKRKVAEL